MRVAERGNLSGIERALAAREYEASKKALGLQAPSRAHDVRTYFEPTGIRVHDRTAPGNPELLTLRLRGLGRSRALAPVASGEVVSKRALVEWYVNSETGV